MEIEASREVQTKRRGDGRSEGGKGGRSERSTIEDLAGQAVRKRKGTLRTGRDGTKEYTGNRQAAAS
jgi:hypothetical protein